MNLHETLPAAGRRAWPWAIGTMVSVVATVLVLAVLAMPETPLGLTERFQNPDSARLLAERSEVGNPVTAVLLNFRAYDTLLEVAVLLLAVLAVQAASSGPGLSRIRFRRNPLLAAAVAVVAPVSIIVAGDMLWLGTDYPGGAFQAGAVLGGAVIMLVLAGRVSRLQLPAWAWRLAITLGAIVFVGIGLGFIALGGHFLQYPQGWTARWILPIEAAVMVSVASVFVLLFSAAVGESLGEAGRSDSISPEVHE